MAADTLSPSLFRQINSNHDIVQNVEKNPILRTYAKIKTTLGIEIFWYGKKFQVQKWYHHNSHQPRSPPPPPPPPLEVEKGRHR